MRKRRNQRKLKRKRKLKGRPKKNWLLRISISSSDVKKALQQ